jgi:nitrate/TMAO reductase-like tetraheme cytochrome c subunit
MKRRFPDSFYNPVTIAGAALALASFVTIVFLTFVDLLQTDSPAYIGIISYVALPVPLVIGLLLIPLGVLREKRRIRRGLAKSSMHFSLDLNSSRHRRLLTEFSVITVILLLFTAYGSYRSFEWTESTEFCGKTCHSVMSPEFTAYENSPHARVKCVECHVGAGAGWYVKSKLSGAYQVYAVMANVYPRPIPTPIRNLRPAQETCEQCHWPSHFSGEKKFVNTYFKGDSANTRWTIALLMKIGGGSPDRTPAGGIHWHMNIANEITYVATDTQRQVIPWVKFKNKQTGAEVEYVSTDAAVSADSLRKLETHRVDCIDCHNRPSHIYRPPVRIVDVSMALGHISTELPKVKPAAIQALVQPYTSTRAAMDSIPLFMNQYYTENYPEVAANKKELIAQASEELKTQYQRNFFPQMKVSWRSYPNDIGHQTSLGCFRCHDGKHVSSTGKIISKNCNSCHTILYQGSDPVPTTMNAGGLEFQHPEDIGDAWKETNCSDCHNQ